MNFNITKYTGTKTAVFKPYQQELEKIPRQFCDYMNETNNRFNEICTIYLDGMSIDDVAFMKPEDLINIVPPENYRHKLLMTIMVRRYLYNQEYDNYHNDNHNDTHHDNEHNNKHNSDKSNHKSHKSSNKHKKRS